MSLKLEESIEGRAQIGLKEGKKLHAERVFSDEARKELEKRGYEIYTLSGLTLGLFLEKYDLGFEFRNELPENFDLFKESSRSIEVAINPDKFFISGSDGKTFMQQEEIVNKYNSTLSKLIPGVKAEIGNAAEYIELVYLINVLRNEKLAEKNQLFGGTDIFGKERNYVSARSTSECNKGSSIQVGHFFRGGKGVSNSLRIFEWPKDKAGGDIVVSPFVVPA